MYLDCLDALDQKILTLLTQNARYSLSLIHLFASLDVHDLGRSRSGGSLFLGQRERTDGGVRADISALVALYAGLGLSLIHISTI